MEILCVFRALGPWPGLMKFQWVNDRLATLRGRSLTMSLSVSHVPQQQGGGTVQYLLKCPGETRGTLTTIVVMDVEGLSE